MTRRGTHYFAKFHAVVLLICCLPLCAGSTHAAELQLKKEKEIRLSRARLTCMACSPGGSLIAGSSADGTISIWDREGVLLRSYTGARGPSPVVALAFSPDEKLLAIAPERGFPQIMKVAGGEGSDTIRWLESPCAVAISPDSAMLALGTRSGDILLWDLASRRLLRVLSGHTYFVTALVFSGKDSLASGSWDRTVRLWNVRTGKMEKILREPVDRPPLLWSSPGASYTNEDRGEAKNQPVVSLGVSQNQLAWGGLDGTIAIWDLTTGEVRKKLKGDASEASSLSFACDDHILAWGSGFGSISLCDPVAKSGPVVQKGHGLAVRFICFMSHEKCLISGSLDGALCVWSYTTR